MLPRAAGGSPAAGLEKFPAVARRAELSLASLQAFQKKFLVGQSGHPLSRRRLLPGRQNLCLDVDWFARGLQQVLTK